MTGDTATEAYVPGTFNAGKTGTSNYGDDECQGTKREWRLCLSYGSRWRAVGCQY